MKSIDQEITPAQGKVRTTTVLIFIAAFAIILSWLLVYCVPNSLISADLINKWPRGKDPRPMWLLNAFGAIFAVLGVLACIFAWASNRQLRRIDAMADAEDIPR